MPVQVSASTDQGKTWNFLSTVVERKADGVNGVWEPAMRLSNDGNVQLYYSSESGPNDQQGYVVSTADGGVSWSAPTTVSRLAGSRDGMIGVATVSGNHLM